MTLAGEKCGNSNKGNGVCSVSLPRLHEKQALPWHGGVKLSTFNVRLGPLTASQVQAGQDDLPQGMIGVG